jgi:murein DD-endopeptidase MepM/ murein hydrolase activator NlpD
MLMKHIRPHRRLYKNLRNFIVVCGVIVFGCLINMPTATAREATYDEKTLRALGIYFVGDSGFTCKASPINLVGSDNAEKTYNFLVGKGLTPIQAAGIMGNLQAESGFDPQKVQGGAISDTIISGKGYGIAQWTDPNRQQNLADFAAKAGALVGDLGVQLNFLYFESTEGTRAGAWQKQAQQTDVRAATYAWEDNYESPKIGHQENRVQFANALLVKFGSNTTSSSNSTFVVANPCDASGQVVNGYSLPVDKNFYDTHQGLFTQPHHDYPAVDIPMPTGTAIFAIAGGTISRAPTGGDCGLGLVIDAGNGIQFSYCHGIDGGAVDGARQGDKVNPGQLIMHSGNTGHSTGPHLHVGIKVGGENVCPQTFLVGIATGSIPDITRLPSSGCIS